VTCEGEKIRLDGATKTLKNQDSWAKTCLFCITRKKARVCGEILRGKGTIQEPSCQGTYRAPQEPALHRNKDVWTFWGEERGNAVERAR